MPLRALKLKSHKKGKTKSKADKQKKRENQTNHTTPSNRNPKEDKKLLVRLPESLQSTT